ncbi:ABC transporter permease [Gaoshiqia sediminis]|uniref:ABC transporter permease n=1 Tax=Gaoshiqia sediminis TaxID=2986998 RepID=A0AA42C688_9BACT|nr:ABC transporter permease [Gaoshiqia sediminis]MCW0483648.1 ABC transporter permease [Gaoshiqia sediminis]
MNTADISISGLAFGLLLIAPSVLLVWQLRLGFNRQLIISVLRMLVQLGFVGFYLKYIFLLDHVLVNLAYVCLMVLFAAFSGIRNSSLRLKKLWLPTFASMLLPTLFTMLYFNAAIVQLDNVFQADVLIPVAGLMLGNVLKTNIVALKTFFSLARKEEKTYLFLLAAGATRKEAVRPFLKEAIRTGMAPNIATMATVGLVSLPGVMTGQILGGSDPVLAVKYQIMVMIIIFFTSLFSNVLQLLFAVHQGFDRHDKLNRDLLQK